jgi:hypothetical protein
VPRNHVIYRIEQENRPGSKEFQKYVDLSVDESISNDIFHVPPEAGLRLYGVGSPQILGLQIGTQFCPGNDNPAQRDD